MNLEFQERTGTGTINLVLVHLSLCDDTFNFLFWPLSIFTTKNAYSTVIQYILCRKDQVKIKIRFRSDSFKKDTSQFLNPRWGQDFQSAEQKSTSHAPRLSLCWIVHFYDYYRIVSCWVGFDVFIYLFTFTVCAQRSY